MAGSTSTSTPSEAQTIHVFWDGREIPAVIRATPLDDPDSVELTLERSLTNDPSVGDWTRAAMELVVLPDSFDKLHTITKDLRIEQRDPQGKVTGAWIVRGCRPSEHAPHPADLGQPADETSVERFVVVHEGCEREE